MQAKRRRIGRALIIRELRNGGFWAIQRLVGRIRLIGLIQLDMANKADKTDKANGQKHSKPAAKAY